MSISLFVLLDFLIASIALNIFLFIKAKKAAKQPTPTKEAQEFLAEIASGSAILNIKVIDPGDLFLRSPRG